MSERHEPEKSKGGRPLKHAGEGRRPTITFRCRTTLQSRLQAAAQAADRSLSEEIEQRLAQSFEAGTLTEHVARGIQRSAEDAEMFFLKLARGSESLSLFVQLMHTAALAEFKSGRESNKRWFNDAKTRDQVEADLIAAIPYFLRNMPKAFGSIGSELERDAFRKEWHAAQSEGTDDEIVARLVEIAKKYPDLAPEWTKQHN